MKQRGSEETSPDRSEDGGERFRVRVCMRRYFSDERALALVCVRGGRPVRWLQRRLRALFPLPPRFALLCAGHLLPPDEPLAVLARDDVVDVVPSQVDLDRHWAEGDDVDAVCRTAASVPECGTSDSNRSTAASDRDVTNRCCPTYQRDSVTVPAEVDVTPSPFSAAQEHDDGDKLSERKRRALDLLDQYCGTEQGSEGRPRRRRVRRRRREPREDHAPSALEDVVLRNGIQRPLTPRLIRPLTDAVSS